MEEGGSREKLFDAWSFCFSISLEARSKLDLYLTTPLHMVERETFDKS